MDSATLYRAIIITEKTLVYLKRSECLFKPDIGRRQNYSSRKVLGKKKKKHTNDDRFESWDNYVERCDGRIKKVGIDHIFQFC